MSCQRETYKNCKPRTVNVPETKCYDVTTKDCYYEEKVDYEVVDTYFPKQVCYTDKGNFVNFSTFLDSLSRQFVYSTCL